MSTQKYTSVQDFIQAVQKISAGGRKKVNLHDLQRELEGKMTPNPEAVQS